MIFNVILNLLKYGALFLVAMIWLLFILAIAVNVINWIGKLFV